MIQQQLAPSWPKNILGQNLRFGIMFPLHMAQVLRMNIPKNLTSWDSRGFLALGTTFEMTHTKRMICGSPWPCGNPATSCYHLQACAVEGRFRGWEPQIQAVHHWILAIPGFYVVLCIRILRISSFHSWCWRHSSSCWLKKNLCLWRTEIWSPSSHVLGGLGGVKGPPPGHILQHSNFCPWQLPMFFSLAMLSGDPWATGKPGLMNFSVLYLQTNK